jgi:hypothetical protein
MADVIVPAVKSFVAFMKGAFSFREHSQKRVGSHLKEIADLLEIIKEQLKAGIVPRESSYQLATLINFTNEELNGVFRLTNHGELEELFSEKLPHLGYLLREADVFIDGTPRSSTHRYMLPLKARDDDYQVSSQSVSKAVEEIDRVVGSLRATASGLAEIKTRKKSAPKKSSRSGALRKKAAKEPRGKMRAKRRARGR